MKKTTLLTILCLSGFFGYGQIIIGNPVLGPAGDSFQNEDENLSLDWTMSEITVESFGQEDPLSLFLGFFLPDNITGLTAPDPKFQLEVFPNPCSGILNISVPEYRKITVEVFDQNGKIVLAKQINLNGISDEINLSFLPAGTYYLRTIDVSTHSWTVTKIQKI